MLRLDIGSGKNASKVLHDGRSAREDGWLSVDAYTPADVNALMWALPFGDASVDDIWCMAALEHIPRRYVQPTLAEWLRVLKPGHRCVVGVPNFDYVAKFWLDNGPSQLSHDLVFGNQNHDGEFHKCGWNADSFRNEAEVAGFRIDKLDVIWANEYTQEIIVGVLVKP